MIRWKFVMLVIDHYIKVNRTLIVSLFLVILFLNNSSFSQFIFC